MSDRGSASAVVLIVILFLSALFLTASMSLEISLRQLRRSEQRDARRLVLLREARRTLQLLLEDPTPQADSPQDPVWSARPLAGGCTVDLEDLSSRLGLNWVRKELLESLGVLKPGSSAQELEQFREDAGIHLNLKPAFLKFILEDELDSYFTAYTYFNVNIGDESALRKLHFTRGGDLAAAEQFHAAIQRLRIEKTIVEPSELEQKIGAENYQLLYPILNAEAVMNLHFVPAAVLRGLFLHYQVPVEKAESILASRLATEFAAAELATLLGKEAFEKTPLRQYLGVRTWFWQVQVRCGQDSLRWVIARLPGTEDAARLQVLEEQFSL